MLIASSRARVLPARGRAGHACSRSAHLPSQALTLPGFALTHCSAAFSGSMCLPAIRFATKFWSFGRPLPALDHADGRRAALRELRRHQLVDDRLPVRAPVDAPVAAELRVVRVDALLAARRQLDLGRAGTPCSGTAACTSRRGSASSACTPASSGRPAPAPRRRETNLRFEAELLDQLRVLLDVRRVAAEEHPLRPRLRALEDALLALQALPRLELRVLLHQVRRDEPADVRR